MTTQVESPPGTKHRKGHVPGEPGLWLFLVGDMIVFGIFFCVVTAFRSQHTAEFTAAQDTLHLHWAVLNTVVLLTSSMFVVVGMQLARVRHHRAPQFLLAAVGCGLIFAAVKAIEYTTLIQDDHTASASDFYMYYFMFTGIHLAHVIVGCVALVVGSRIAAPGSTAGWRMPVLEGVASFWHLVDLLWIMLFATFYLMR